MPCRPNGALRWSKPKRLATEGYLDDAVQAIEAREFERALEALVRSDYEPARLKDATGQ